MTSLLAQVDLGEIDDLVDPTALSWWDVLGAFIAVVGGYVLARFARSATRRLVDRIDGVPPNLSDLAGSIAFWAVLSTAVVLALTLLGFDTGPLVLFLLLFGVIIVLSGRALLENFGAGVILQVRSPFEVGEQIDVASHKGEVVEINGRTTVVRTMDGTLVHIPNSMVIANPIVNITGIGRHRSRIDVGVEYGTDLARAREVILEAAASAPTVLADPPPETFVTEFDDSAITFAVRFWHEPTIRQGFVTSDEVARAIDAAFKTTGIVIAFPQRTLWWGDDSGASGAA